MRKVTYGNETINYTTDVNDKLKSHYVVVARETGVQLKGKKIAPELADKLVLKRARWILNKLDVLGKRTATDAIVSGSRLTYLGRSYYVHVIVNPDTPGVAVEFTHSAFKVYLRRRNTPQREIRAAIESFYKEKAIEKITPRVGKWSERTRLDYNGLSFRKMAKRWGSCTPGNKIIINYNAVQLPYSLIDYLIVHELCHTKLKDHSRRYWLEVSKHMPNWQIVDDEISQLGFVDFF